MPIERSAIAGSAALRGALWITLIALLTTSVALTVQYVQTTRLLQERTRALVDDEAASLLARYQAAGIGGVAGAIRRAESLPRINEFFYLLASPGGEPLVGNLAGWPEEIDRSGYHSFSTQVASTGTGWRERSVEARAVILPGGFRLLVGNLSDEQKALQERYLSALVWSLLATGALGLALGFWYSRRGLAFVDQASSAGERFLRGNLAERLPVSGRGDEYDRLGETINRTFAETERLVGSLRAATEGLAHDLKTPLTRIRARLDLAELQASDEQRLRTAMAESREDIESILRLIADVLGLARAEATAAASFVPVQFDALVAEAAELFEPVAEERGVRLETDLAPVRLSGARALLAQTATNLIDNAIKYTPPGGVVRVELHRTAEAARFVVTDEGPGIPEAQREIALQRFARLDASRSEPGSGLGLSIVAAAARVHRATLRLGDNQPGLRVEVIFPIGRAETLS
ncbi:sensor histidine kinase [Altericroceibacterium xinjiangense]|uniref:sensor histidine kinase n=1 Tax=Altericroceibacterium xinjiangense TaxID=762261 RepID=UPI000F7D8E14|nr:HAMP domain-containing sensor histidine kinase [Altericroceibacterium xinjiangense]